MSSFTPLLPYLKRLLSQSTPPSQPKPPACCCAIPSEKGSTYFLYSLIFACICILLTFAFICIIRRSAREEYVWSKHMSDLLSRIAQSYKDLSNAHHLYTSRCQDGKARQVYLVTGASTGLGALAASALAREGHVVFAGIDSHDKNKIPYVEDAGGSTGRHDLHLRTVTLDLLSQESVDAAVQHVIKTVGRIDGVVHSTSHANFGPAESFTAEQYLRLYDMNVVGAHRLNTAVLPHMRRERRGHLIWIGSASTYGCNGPYRGAYFSTMAALDSLAQSYAAELSHWGVESTIVDRGIFKKGSNHFLDASRPGRPDVASEYDEGPTKSLGSRTMAGAAALVSPDVKPQNIAEALVEIAKAPRGKKPFRVFMDPIASGGEAAAAVVDNNRVNTYRRLGILEFLTVQI